MTRNDLIRKLSKQLRLIPAVVMMLGFSLSSAQAAPLGLSLPDSPDIFSSPLTFSYTASTKAFSANGFAVNYWDGVNDTSITGGTFALSGLLNASNKPTGTLEIDGMLGALGSGVLLKGTLTDFGFAAPGGVLEFLFNVTGGDLAGAYGSGGGVILGGADWNGIADNGGSSVASSDTGSATPVPEPSSVALLMLGGLGLAYVRCRRSTKNS